jgi:Amt family ammonium transporter
VVLSVIMFDKAHIDDPVGALSVHLVNGVFGTLCVGLFAESQWMPNKANGLLFGGGATQLIAQLTGVVAAGAAVFAVSLLAWWLIKVTMGIRVSVQEEIDGLDIGEHGNSAYSDFVVRKTLPVSTAAPVPAAAPAGR